VVLPIVAPDSQPEHSLAVDTNRLLRVHGSDATSAQSSVPTVLDSDVEDEGSALISEQDVSLLLEEHMGNNNRQPLRGVLLQDDEEEEYPLGSHMPPAPRRSRSPRSRPPRVQPPQQQHGASSPPPSSRRPIIDMPVYGLMSTGEMFRHILTAPSRVTSALVITGEEQMNDAFEHCNRTVSRIVRSGRQFYIGITEHHSRRWEEHQGDTPGMWAGMITLVQAPNSRMTAQLERRLIAQWGHHTTCRNIGRGGERASQGQPHFVYCLDGQNHGLIRHHCNRGATHDLIRHHRGR